MSEFDYADNHKIPDNLDKHKKQVDSMTLDEIVRTKTRLLGQIIKIARDRYTMFIRPLDYVNLHNDVYTNASLTEGNVLIPINAYVWFNIDYEESQGYYAVNVTWVVS